MAALALTLTTPTALAAPGPGGLAPAISTPRHAASDRLDADEQRELEHLVDDLKDPKLEFDRRRRAASILLDRAWPAAVNALRRQLLDADATAHRAIAQALVTAPQTPVALLYPLTELLGSDDAALREDIAVALSRYDTPPLIDRLTDFAIDPRQQQAMRRGSIRALAGHRTPAVVQTLLRLAPDADPLVRSAAFSALAHLSGVSHGEDADAWQEWWQSVRHLDDASWQAMLVRNLAALNAAQTRELQAANDRLLSAHNSLYEATPEAGRTAILQQMLIDPMRELRLLALKLIERRVLNAQTVAPEVRTEMRQRLTDRSPHVRAQAARLLETLADAQGAQLAVDLLLQETDPAAQAAYLALLARVPQTAAVEPALLVIERPTLRTAAAAVLVASCDAKLLNTEQTQRALRIARFHLVDNDQPDPMMLRLIGRLGDASDESLVITQLQHKDAAIRLAAAEAFIASSWLLPPLMDRLDDPALWATIVQGAAKRGQSGQSLLTLLSNEPREQAQLPVWREAVLAIASRLNVSGLNEVDARLAATPHRRELHEELLKSAAGLLTPTAPAATPEVTPSSAELEERRIEAAFRLATFYLATDQPAKAKAVYERLADRDTLNPAQRQRLADARLTTLLDVANYEEAADLARKLLADTPPLPAPVLAEPWLAAAERALQAGDTQTARTLTIHAHGLFGARLKPPASHRLTSLQKKLLPANPASPASPTAPKPPVKAATRGA